MQDLGNAFNTMADAIQLCSNPKDLAELKKLRQMIESFKDPHTFAAHVEKNVVVNGKDIFGHIQNAVPEFKNE